MGIGGGVAAGDCASPSSAWALRQQAASTIKKISHHLHLPNDPRGSSPELSQDLKDAGIVLRSWLRGFTSCWIVIDRVVVGIFRIRTAPRPPAVPGRLD